MATTRKADTDAPGPTRAKVDDVEDLLTVAQDDDAIWLWRRNGDRDVFLESRSPAAFRALGVRETTRQRTGGGDYRARIRRRVGSHWGEQRRFEIAGEALSVPTDTAPPAGVHAPAPAAAAAAPWWIDKILIPTVAALGTGIAAALAKKMLETKPDPMAIWMPLMLELIKDRGGRKGDGMNTLELMELLQRAEERGEDRAKEFGELMERLERAGRATGNDSGGVIAAIREATPLFNKLLDRADRARRLPAPAPEPAVPNAPARPIAGAEAGGSDIVPVWLRPFMSYKGLLIHTSDTAASALPIAGLVIENADDATWAAMLSAHAAGRLKTDLLGAIPELDANERRQQFTAELLAELEQAIAKDVGTSATVNAAPPAKPPKASKRTTTRTTGSANA